MRGGLPRCYEKAGSPDVLHPGKNALKVRKGKPAMKKAYRKEEQQAKANRKEAKKTIAKISEFGDRAANSLVIGIDLGDRTSTYTVRSRDAQEVLMRSTVTTAPEKILEAFCGLQRQRIIVETGTHSRWMAQLLEMMGHEVIVGDARKLKLISENNTKSDKVDADLLSSLGCMNVDWLHPVYVRKDETHRDLMLVRSREALMQARTALINHVRGTVKAFGMRVKSCDADQFVEVAAEGIPKVLEPALSGVLEILAALSEQIYEYDCHIAHLGQTKYQDEVKWLTQVKGVGPITGLTFVLTIEEPGRFEKSRDVGAYLGLTRKTKQSGNKDPQLGITKAGDELLRKLLVNCAHWILGYRGEDCDLRRWGMDLMERGGSEGKKGARNRAAVAVARKLAVLLHLLWARREQYEPLRKGVVPKAA